MIRLDQPEYKKIEFIAQAGKNFVSFSQGALRTGGVPHQIRDVAREILATDGADYYCHPLGLKSLREKLALTLSTRHKVNLSMENVMVSHGSVNGMSAACLTLLHTGDEVLLPEPTYPTYFNIVTLAKAIPVFVNACVESTDIVGNKRWALDIDAIKAATTKRTKMIMLSNPSNPCGVCLNPMELQELKIWCDLNGIYLILDEVYDNFIFDETVFNSGTPLVAESEFIIRAGSFSKDYAMSGWRVGFIVAQPHLIHNMMCAQDGLICCPSVIAQHAAEYALDHKYLMQPQIEQIYANRNTVCMMLDQFVQAGIFTYIKPKAGFFAFIKTNLPDSTPLVHEILEKSKVALVPGKDFGPSGKPYIRLCYARQPQIIHEGFARLFDYFGLSSSETAIIKEETTPATQIPLMALVLNEQPKIQEDRKEMPFVVGLRTT